MAASSDFDRKQQADFRVMNQTLDKTLSVMSQYPAGYRTTISKVSQARKLLSSDRQKVIKLLSEAYDAAIEESDLVMRFHRTVDRITPEDPIFKEAAVVRLIGEFESGLRNDNLKGSRKAVEQLERTIGGRGENCSMSVNLVTTTLPRGDDKVIVTLANVGKKDILVNKLTASSTAQTEHILLKEPVIRSGNSINQEIKVQPTDEPYITLRLTVEYTKDFIPVSQSFVLKIVVK